MPSSFLQRQTLGALRSRRDQLKSVPGFAKTIVRPSLSPEQLISDRLLREQPKQKRAENPGVKIYIKDGKIVVDGQFFNCALFFALNNSTKYVWTR